MPMAEVSKVLEAPLEAVFQMLSDPAAVGRLFAFVEETEVNPERVLWHLKDQQRKVTRTPHLKAETSIRGERVRISAVGRYLHLDAVIRLRPVEERTEVSLRLRMEIIGALAPILNLVVSANIGGQAKAFLRNLEAALEEA